ncbi:MAG: SDR family oxidoreductase [Sandaracinaceae bacterium]
MPVAVIQGASRGLGLEFVRQLRATHEVVATCRKPDGAEALRSLGVETVQLDVTDEASVARAAETVGGRHPAVHLLLNVSGLLHDANGLGPEKRLADVEPEAMARVFAVNAYGPLLVAKHFHRLLTRHRQRAVLANLSARVGSIEDNRLGGWYAYRGSKAAQNLFTRNVAIELGRASEEIIVMALHPGTVETDLSAPFRRNARVVFPVDQAARQLLDVIGGATRETHHGGFFAWDGRPIPW